MFFWIMTVGLFFMQFTAGVWLHVAFPSVPLKWAALIIPFLLSVSYFLGIARFAFALPVQYHSFFRAGQPSDNGCLVHLGRVERAENPRHKIRGRAYRRRPGIKSGGFV